MKERKGFVRKERGMRCIGRKGERVEGGREGETRSREREKQRGRGQVGGKKI